VQFATDRRHCLADRQRLTLRDREPLVLWLSGGVLGLDGERR
jgi:hypothetical protein